MSLSSSLVVLLLANPTQDKQTALLLSGEHCKTLAYEYFSVATVSYTRVILTKSLSSIFSGTFTSSIWGTLLSQPFSWENKLLALSRTFENTEPFNAV